MQLIEGFMAVLHPATLFLIIGGVVAGIVFGAIPGLSHLRRWHCSCPLHLAWNRLTALHF